MSSPLTTTDTPAALDPVVDPPSDEPVRRPGEGSRWHVTRRALTRLFIELVTTAVIVALSTLVVFVVLFGAGNPARAIAGDQATQEQVRQVTEDFGFDRPVLEQYGSWVGNVLQGDLGRSFHYGQRPVAGLLSEQLIVTIQLVVGSIVLATGAALIAGYVVARWPESWADRAISFLAAAGISLPPYFVGLVLASFIGATWDLLPSSGWVAFGQDPVGWAEHMALPWIALAVGVFAQQVRTLRSSVLTELNADYVYTARSKGLSRSRVIVRHVFPNAMPPLFAVIGLQVPRVVTFAVIVEVIFALPGVGSTLVTSVQTQDFPVIQAIVAVLALLAVAANRLADFASDLLVPARRAAA